MAFATPLEVRTVDCDYVRPQFAAAYLIVDRDANYGAGEAVIVETGTAHSISRLLAALVDAGLTPAQVKYIIITHIHLDHAGGASALMQACPHATLLAHPRAAVHAIDPSRLVASARQVYGDAEFDRLYGEISPIAQARVRALDDEAELAWGDRDRALFKFLHTRGHANHHFCVRLSAPEFETAIFTGDAFGLAYPRLRQIRPVKTRASRDWVMPTTSPTDFDGPEALRSVDRIVTSGAVRAFPTHYGELRNLAGVAEQLRVHLRVSDAWVAEAQANPISDGDLNAWMNTRVRPYFLKSLAECGINEATADFADVLDLLAMDFDLNAAGLAHAVRRKRK